MLILLTNGMFCLLIFFSEETTEKSADVVELEEAFGNVVDVSPTKQANTIDTALEWGGPSAGGFDSEEVCFCVSI